MNRRSVASLLAIGSIALVACGDDGGTPMMTSDAGALVLPIASYGDRDSMGMAINLMPADFSCVGVRTAPMPGDNVSFEFKVEDFQEETTTEGVFVKIFPDNLVTDEVCTEATCPRTDAMGKITAMGRAGGWYAYRIFPKTDGPTAALRVVGSIQYNEVAPMMGGSNTGNSVSEATIGLIPTVLGIRRQMGTALVAGRFIDCGGEDLYGMRVRMFRMDGTEITEGAPNNAPHFRYFDGDEFPDSRAVHTNVDGLWAGANIPVPPGSEPVRIEMWGRRMGDAEPRILGCEAVRIFADSVTIVNIEPLRADGPTCSTAP